MPTVVTFRHRHDGSLACGVPGHGAMSGAVAPGHHTTHHTFIFCGLSRLLWRCAVCPALVVCCTLFESALLCCLLYRPEYCSVVVAVA